MKEFLKALKLYTKVSFPSLRWLLLIPVALFGIFCVFAYSFNNEYDLQGQITTFAICSFYHFGLALFCSRSDKYKTWKFFSSTQSAKKYYTTMPTVSTGIICISFDIAMFISAVLLIDVEFAMNCLMVNAVSTVACCLMTSTNAIPVLNSIGGVISIILLAYPALIISKTIGYNLPFVAELIISLAVYAVGMLSIIGMMILWWNKSGRNFKYEENKSILMTKIS